MSCIFFIKSSPPGDHQNPKGLTFSLFTVASLTLQTILSVLSVNSGSSKEKPLFKDALTGDRPRLIPIRLGHFEADASMRALISQQS